MSVTAERHFYQLPVGIPFLSNGLQEMQVIRIKGQGGVNINPTHLTSIIACLQWKLTYTIA